MVWCGLKKLADTAASAVVDGRGAAVEGIIELLDFLGGWGGTLF